MSKLIKHIEDVRSHLLEVAANEQTLVRALADALNRVDDQLLADVRTLTEQHEARRGAILGELHTLAARIGVFPPPREHVAALETAPLDAPHELSHHNGHGHNGHVYAAPGDWRQAARNVPDDLDFDNDFHAPRVMPPH